MSFGRPKEDKERDSEKGASAGSLSIANAARSEAFLGKGCKIVGNLFFATSAEIEGTVEGEISGERILIGEGAQVVAKITAAEIVVRGNVKGDIIATKRLILKRPAKIIGNITAPIISMEEGVNFEGKCSMGSLAASSKELSDLRPELVSLVSEKHLSDKVA